MKISSTLKTALERLISGESIAASSLRKDFADILLAEGLLTVQTHGTRRTFRAIDSDALKRFLQSRYEELRMIGDEIRNTYETRSEQAAETGNSKLVKVRSCPGFPINSYEPIACTLRDDEFVVNPPAGSFVFVDDWQSFTVPADVIIVGIENMENFRMIRRQRQFFETEIGIYRMLFVSRYPQSTDLRCWLQTIPNRYVHFGDFDLAGINIFQTEFRQHLGPKATFLIPHDIEQRLARGSRQRYDDQYARYHDIQSDVPELQALINLINRLHRGYDQEGYIETI